MSTACCAIVCVWAASAARAQVVYVDTRNPQGIPDITQGTFGICGSASVANLLWNWSEFPPLDGSAGGLRLTPHPGDATWPAAFANWNPDSISLRNALAVEQYGPNWMMNANGGFGQKVGATRYINSRGRLWSSGFFGGGNPNGLSVRTNNDIGLFGTSATWANLRPYVINPDNQTFPFSSVSTHWQWHNADGTIVQNDNVKSRHALVAAGLRTNDTELFLTNGWGSQQNNANPVSAAYYDQYTTINTNGGGAGRLRIPTGMGAHNNGAGNDYLVRSIPNTGAAAFVEMYQFMVIKQGGSPEVGLTVLPDAMTPALNRFRYQVYNPEPTPQHHFFLEVPGSVLGGLSLGEVQSPPGWGVSFWNPAGSITDPLGAPAEGDLLFGNTFAIEGSGVNPAWNPALGGLHWYWEGLAGNPVMTGQVLDFSFALDGQVPYRLDKTFATVVGEIHHGVHYYNMVGGPVPEPGAAVVLLTAVLAFAGPFRRLAAA